MYVENIVKLVLMYCKTLFIREDFIFALIRENIDTQK